MWQKNWGNLCRKIKLHQSWWEPAGRKKMLRRKIPFVWTRKERRPTEEQEYNVDWRLVRIFRQFLHQFFSSHFCGHATKSHFSVTIRQQHIIQFHITHSWNSIFSQYQGSSRLDTYIFASVFFPLIQILTKTAEIIQKRVDVKRGLYRNWDLRLKSDSKIRVKWMKIRVKWIKIRVKSYHKVFESAF